MTGNAGQKNTNNTLTMTGTAGEKSASYTTTITGTASHKSARYTTTNCKKTISGTLQQGKELLNEITHTSLK